MLRWLENYFARRATIRRLGQYVSPQAVEEILSGNFQPPQPESRKTQFVLVLVKSETPEMMQVHMATVFRVANDYGWAYPTTLGGLLQLQNPQHPDFTSETPPEILAAAIQEKLGPNARLLYGEETFLIGSLEMGKYRGFSSLWPQFPVALKRLCALRDGDCEEFNVGSL